MNSKAENSVLTMRGSFKYNYIVGKEMALKGSS